MTYFEEHLRTAPSELTLESDCLKLCLLTVASFKHNSPNMPSLYLTPTLSFKPRFRVFIISGYYTKSKR